MKCSASISPERPQEIIEIVGQDRKLQIGCKLMDNGEVDFTSITIECDDFYDAFGMSSEEMTERITNLLETNRYE